ncbi:MAG: SPOR domain-containing protein [Chakrabartia sp.]
MKKAVMKTGLVLTALPLALAAPALAQVSPTPTTAPPPTLVVGGSGPAALLSENLKALARDPYNVEAILQAGNGALAIGDTNAAFGFFARAEELSPRSWRAKAGLGSSLVLMEKPTEALRAFDEAASLGAPEQELVADRGLAFDLMGDTKRAQRDYLAALKLRPSDEVTRRLALSLAIGGDRDAGLARLDPLVRRNDQGAWRARAFILAMTGDSAGAEKIVRQVAPPNMAGYMSTFLQRIAGLGPSAKAHAVHFGTLPAATAAPQVAVVSDSFRPVDPNAAVRLAAQEPQPRAAPSSANADIRDARRRAREAHDQDLLAARSRAAAAPALPSSAAPSAASARPALAPSPAPAPPPVRVAAATPAPAPQPVRAAAVAPSAYPGWAPTAPAAAPVSNAQPVIVSAATPVPAAQPSPAPTAAASAPPAALFEVPPMPARGAAPAPVAPPVTAPAPAPAVQSAELQPASPSPSAVAAAAPAETAADWSAPSEAPAPAAASAAPQPARLALSDIVRTLDLERESAPVALPDAAKIKALRLAAQKKAAAEEKARAEKAEQARKAAEEAAQARRNPSRLWVQIATGGNKSGLSRTWRNLKNEAPDALSGRKAWYVPYIQTYRVLVGPFRSDDDARALVKSLRKEGVKALTFESEAGQEITRIEN